MKKEIVSAEDLVKLNSKFRYFGGKTAAKLVLRLLQINRLNKIYAKNLHLQPYDFIDGIYNDLGLSYTIDRNELLNIPRVKPFILIANHPFGGAEAIITLKLIKDIRPDFKYMANFLLNQIEPLQPYFISVNPFENMKSLKSNITGLKMAGKHIQLGHPLGVFPAGEVSTFQNGEKMITDKAWPNSIMKFIKYQKVEIIPMYFEGTNSKLFHRLGKIHPMLRTLKLPSELLNKNNCNIGIRVGKPISIEKQNEFTDINSYMEYLRDTTYKLKNTFS